MNPSNQDQAAAQARELLAGSLPGAHSTVRGHLTRAAIIGSTIWRRFQVGPYRWQVKHLRWYLDQTQGLAPSSRYDHWRTVQALTAALGRYKDWRPHLVNGPWMRPTGEKSLPLGIGRPSRRPGG